MAFIFYYMAQGVNELTANGVEKGVNGLLSMINLNVTIVENIVLFIINMMIQIYVCLITFIVNRSFHAAVQFGDKVMGILNSTISVIGDNIANITRIFEKDFNSFINSLKNIPFANINPPMLNFDMDIQKLKSLTMPIDFSTSLQDFNNSISTFANVQNFIETIIKFLFEEVKNFINETLRNFTFNCFSLFVP